PPGAPAPRGVRGRDQGPRVDGQLPRGRLPRTDPGRRGMSALGALVAAKARAAGHAAASVRRESKLKIAVVSVSAVVLWLGAAAVFSKGFQLLRAYTLDPTGTGLDLGDVVMARLLSVFSLALFFMLLFSNVLV